MILNRRVTEASNNVGDVRKISGSVGRSVSSKVPISLGNAGNFRRVFLV